MYVLFPTFQGISFHNFYLGICFQSNYSILHLEIPDNPSKPCLSCTKQWCLNQNLPICYGASLGDTDPDTATGKEGDVEARCFRTCISASFLCIHRGFTLSLVTERDSPRDQLVVTLFLLTVFGLLLGAGIKSRMLKAGLDTSIPWNAGRRWWEVSAVQIFLFPILTKSPLSLLGMDSSETTGRIRPRS